MEQYSGIQLCDILRPKHKCFRLQTYSEGKFVLVFHEHVPSYRLSLDSAIEVMRMLVVRHEAFGDFQALQCYLNTRGTAPAANGLLQIHIDRPEPGVIRRGCGANVMAMIDEVIDATRFRTSLVVG